MFEKDNWECFRHPLIRGAIAIAVFVTVSCAFIPPGWAVAIPLPGKYVIDLGDASSWVIAVVAALGFWKSFKAEKAAVAAAKGIDDVKKDTVIVTGKVEQIRHETNSMRAALEKAAKAEGNIEGRAEQKAENTSLSSDAAIARGVISDAATHARGVLSDAAAAKAGGTTGPTGATGGEKT